MIVPTATHARFRAGIPVGLKIVVARK